MDHLLQVTNLKVHLRTSRTVTKAVDGVDLTIHRGECVGIVGESGSGKSTLARAILRLLPPLDLAEFSGEVLFNGVDLRSLDEARLRRLRRTGGFSMIFQDPLSYLNPTQRVGRQLVEVLRMAPHRTDVEKRALALMQEVGLIDPVRVARRYPHELSGGMRQRILIAMALAAEPALLVADEPTTSLDATVQLQVIDTLRKAHQAHNMALLVITHDLGLVAELCDRVYVMYGGKVVENADVFSLFEAPQHPYTAQLVALSTRHSVREQIA